MFLILQFTSNILEELVWSVKKVLRSIGRAQTRKPVGRSVDGLFGCIEEILIVG